MTPVLFLLTLLMASTAGLFPPEDRKAEKSVDLRPKWTVGEVVYFERDYTGNYVSVLSDGSRRGPMTMGAVTGYRCEVVDRTSDDGAIIKITYERFVVSEKSARADFAYDSDKDRPEDVADWAFPIKCAALGTSFEIQVDANATVTELHGIEEAREAALKVATTEATRGYARGVFDGTVERQFWNRHFSSYSMETVAPGATWKRSIDWYTGPNDHEFTLAAIPRDRSRSGERAIIQYRAKEAADETEKHEPPAGDMRISERSMRCEGTAIFDIALGRVVEIHETGRETAMISQVTDAGNPAARYKRTVDWRAETRVIPFAEREKEKAAHRKSK